MGKIGKRHSENLQKVDREKKYSLEEAIEILSSASGAKFDETVDVAINLGVDPRHADQMVRGAVVLPQGIGKELKVVVFAAGEKEKEAKDAGADEFGSDELINKIAGGWLDFDCAIATPDIMGKVSKLGKVLGPRGLMPNPKLGTVTFDVARAVKDAKAGKVEFRTEKTGIVHAGLGKISFGSERILENIRTFIDAILKAKPETCKGTYLRGITLSTTMGPGIKVEPASLKV